MWPADGRMIGIVVDPLGDLGSVRTVRSAVLAAGMVPLLIGPYGGELEEGLPVQRTFLTTRSVEFDAILLAGSSMPAPDAKAARDAKAGAGAGEAILVDPRVRLIVEEAFRHAKVIGAWGQGVDALTASGCLVDDIGIVTGEDAEQVLAGVLEQLGRHRVRERFPVDA